MKIKTSCYILLDIIKVIMIQSLLIHFIRTSYSKSIQKSRMLTMSMKKINNPLPKSYKNVEPITSQIDTKDRPFTLPPGLFKPKQSLGQNYLSDQNYVLKICEAFTDESENGTRAIEIGPGMGALTRVLVRKYPALTAIEIDQRAVAFLQEKIPTLNVIHCDALTFDWCKLAADKGGKLSVIGNLPYYITSQILFSLADSYKAINKAVVTMQLEVAERICAIPCTKQYGIPSVVFQLYGKTTMNFKIPPTVFFPVPKVDSALVTIDFSCPHKDLHLVEGDHLRKIVTTAFRQRRKMMRQSLKDLLLTDKLTIPDKWATKRPEELRPEDFIQLTADIYGVKGSEKSISAIAAKALRKSNYSEKLLEVSSKSRLLHRLKSQLKSVDTSKDPNIQNEINNKQDENPRITNIPPSNSEYVSDFVWRKAMFD